MIARKIHWLQDHLPRAARCQSGSLPIKSRYKYCRLGRFARTPLAGWPFPACCQISHVSSHLELPACLGCAARRPVGLVSGSLGVQGAVHAHAEIGAWLWGRRAAWASIVPAFYDCRRAMVDTSSRRRGRVGLSGGSSWNGTPAFDGKAGPWALGLGGSPVLDETVGHVGEIFWNWSWACRPELGRGLGHARPGPPWPR